MLLTDGFRTLPNNSEIFQPTRNQPRPPGRGRSAGNTVEPLSNLQDLPPSCNPVNGPAHMKSDLRSYGPTARFSLPASTPATRKMAWRWRWPHSDLLPDTGQRNLESHAGHTVYTTRFGCNDMADAPAALLPDGNVLIQTSPGIDRQPASFTSSTSRRTNFRRRFSHLLALTRRSSEIGRMLVVSSGHVFYMHRAARLMKWGSMFLKGTYDPVVGAHHLRSLSTGESCLGCLY